MRNSEDRIFTKLQQINNHTSKGVTDRAVTTDPSDPEIIRGRSDADVDESSRDNEGGILSCCGLAPSYGDVLTTVEEGETCRDVHRNWYLN